MVHLSHLQESVLPSSVGDVHAHAPECWSLTHYHCATEPYYTARNGTCLRLKSRRSIARYSYGPRRDDTNRRTVEGARVVRPEETRREETRRDETRRVGRRTRARMSPECVVVMFVCDVFSLRASKKSVLQERGRVRARRRPHPRNHATTRHPRNHATTPSSS